MSVAAHMFQWSSDSPLAAEVQCVFSFDASRQTHRPSGASIPRLVFPPELSCEAEGCVPVCGKLRTQRTKEVITIVVFPQELAILPTVLYSRRDCAERRGLLYGGRLDRAESRCERRGVAQSRDVRAHRIVEGLACPSRRALECHLRLRGQSIFTPIAAPRCQD